MLMSSALEHKGLTSVQGEVFGEALLKQGYFSIIELETRGTGDTSLKERGRWESWSGISHALYSKHVWCAQSGQVCKAANLSLLKV